MRRIQYEDVPCWFRLSFDYTKPSIRFEFHKGFIKQEFSVITDQSPIVQYYWGEYPNLGRFETDFTKAFGFQGVFVRKTRSRKNTDAYWLYEVEIPDIVQKQTCFWCNGTKRNPGGLTCRGCDGTGVRFGVVWERIHPIACTLSVITTLIEYNECMFDSSEVQLLSFITVYTRGMSGSAIGGTFSKKLADWFRKRGKGEIPEMTRAMKCAWRKMMRRVGDFENHQFYASIDYENGWLNVSCPGNACGINPNYNSVNSTNGYEFGEHNVDTPIQQLSLLAGLAALYDLARNEIYIQKDR